MFKVVIKSIKSTLHWSLCGIAAFLSLTTVQAADSSYADINSDAQTKLLAQEQSFSARASRNVYSPDSSGTAKAPVVTSIDYIDQANALFSSQSLGVEPEHLEFGNNGNLGVQSEIGPLNFGQFLIGQLTLAEYSGVWQSLGSKPVPGRKCSLHFRDNTFVASGPQCISYFNYVEAHSDSKGMLSSISIAGNQPAEQSTEDMLAMLSKRYVPVPYEKLPTNLKMLADLREDLCQDLGKLMEGNYKCQEYWFQFRNFYMVFSPSTYKNTRKEQFTYGTLHHFADYETMMVKRRLAVVRQELNAKQELQELNAQKAVN